MKILIIGGTGAMGSPLVNYLCANKENIIDVVSRHEKESHYENVKYSNRQTIRRQQFS